MIDKFTEFQVVSRSTVGNSCGTVLEASSGNMAGNERDLSVEVTASPYGQSLMTGCVDGNLIQSEGVGVEGYSILQWDGNDNSCNLNPTGLGSISLTAGGEDRFLMDINSIDVPAKLTFRVYTDATHWSQGILLVPGQIGQYYLLYSAFTQGGSSSANFSSVGAIELRIESQVSNQYLDMQFRWLQSSDEPTLVNLASFAAIPSLESILLEWETASEINNAGFRLWRDEKEDGQYTCITETLIPAEGGPSQGAAYAYEDDSVELGTTYYYQLEDMDYGGKSTFHGPVSAAADDAGIVLVSPEDCASFSFFRSPVFEWEGEGLVRFNLEFSTTPDFTTNVIVLPAGYKRDGGWITGESYTPNRREWRKIQRLGRRGQTVYWAVYGEDEAGKGFVSKTFQLKIDN